MLKKKENKNKCSHEWEVGVWEYKRQGTSVMPTHTVANRLYCKHCLVTKQLNEEFYKKSLIK